MGEIASLGPGSSCAPGTPKDPNRYLKLRLYGDARGRPQQRDRNMRRVREVPIDTRSGVVGGLFDRPERPPRANAMEDRAPRGAASSPPPPSPLQRRLALPPAAGPPQVVGIPPPLRCIYGGHAITSQGSGAARPTAPPPGLHSGAGVSSPLGWAGICLGGACYGISICDAEPRALSLVSKSEI